MEKSNRIKLTFSAVSENESFARSVVAIYALRLNPSVEEINDIKTAVSEAVTNSIVHGYPNSKGEITLEAETHGRSLHIKIFDEGVGIENVEQALEPFYTTKLDGERSGIGFTVMKSFMDNVTVESEKGKGTKIYMKKILKTGS